jgi:hypothetical protein
MLSPSVTRSRTYACHIKLSIVTSSLADRLEYKPEFFYVRACPDKCELCLSPRRGGCCRWPWAKLAVKLVVIEPEEEEEEALT